MKCEQIDDERLVSQQHKYGYNSFWILFFGMIILVPVKVFVFNLGVESWLDSFILLAAASLYFTIGCTRAGVFVMPGKPEAKKQLRKTNLMGSIAATIAFIIFTVVFSLATDKNVDYLDLALKTLVGALVFFAVFIGALLLIYRISKKADSKNIE